ncbi:hypothetical protein NRP93_001806 [Clostridium botulinum]|nr:hypothetical protein [Clostridium botulinum]
MRCCMNFGDTNFIGLVNFYDVDKDEYIGTYEKDVLLNFTKVSEFQHTADKVLWCSFW